MATELLVAKAAINNMVKGGHVDICAIRKVLDILGLPHGGKSFECLSALHCINFRDLEPELRQVIPDLLADVLRDDRMDWSAVFSELEYKPLLPAAKSSRLAGLLKW